MSQKRKHISPETKLAIVKAHLMSKTPISELSKSYSVPPSSIYQWQNQLFNGGVEVFKRKNDKVSGNAAVNRYQSKIEELEQKLAKKNEVVVEILEEMVKLKKLSGAT